MQKIWLAISIFSMTAPARAENVIFNLDLKPYPIGPISVQADYSQSNQTMYLADHAFITGTDTDKRILLSAFGSTYTNFFVSRPAYMMGQNQIAANLRGIWAGDKQTNIALTASHFEGLVAIRAENGKAYMVTDAGAKEIGPYKKGWFFDLTMGVDYSESYETPTAWLRYRQQFMGGSKNMVR